MKSFNIMICCSLFETITSILWENTKPNPFLGKLAQISHDSVQVQLLFAFKSSEPMKCRCSETITYCLVGTFLGMPVYCQKQMLCLLS